MLLGVVLQGYAGRLEVKTPVAKPFDAVIVPGCPTQADGGLTLSLQRRAVWAALLWDRRQAEHFRNLGVSGSYAVCRGRGAGSGDDGAGRAGRADLS